MLVRIIDLVFTAHRGGEEGIKVLIVESKRSSSKKEQTEKVIYGGCLVIDFVFFFLLLNCGNHLMVVECAKGKLVFLIFHYFTIFSECATCERGF